MIAADVLAGDEVLVADRGPATVLWEPDARATRVWVTYRDGTREPVLIGQLEPYPDVGAIAASVYALWRDGAPLTR